MIKITRKHLLLGGLCGIVAIFVALAATLFWVAATPGGLQFVIRQAQNYIPGQLTIEKVRGTLLDRIQFYGVDYRQGKALHAELDLFSFQWSFNSLSSRLLYIERLHLDGLRINLTREEPPEEDTASDPPINFEQLPEIHLPVGIVIDQLEVTNVSVSINKQQQVATRYDIDHIQLEKIQIAEKFSLAEGRLKVPAQASLPAVDAIWYNSIDLSPPYASNLQLQIDTLKWPFLPKDNNPEQVIIGNLVVAVEGDLNKYQVNLAAEASGPQIPPSSWQLVGTGDLSHFVIDDLSGRLLDGMIRITGDIVYKPVISAAVTVDIHQINPQSWLPQFPIQGVVNTTAQLSYRNNDVLIDRMRLELPEQQMSLDASGTISQISRSPQFKLGLTWQALKWPLGELNESQSLVYSRRGNLELNGNREHFVAAVDAELNGKDIPQSSWQGVFQGSEQRLHSFEFAGRLLQGEVRLAGSADWAQQPHHLDWNVRVSGENINPGIKWPKVPGKVNFTIQHQGKLEEKQLNAQVLIEDVSGELLGYPLAVKADLRSDGTTHRIKQFSFRSGRNSADAEVNIVQGADAQTIDGTWSIDAPQLSAFIPEVKGRISGKGQIAGNLLRPDIAAKIDARGLMFKEWTLDVLSADMNLGLNSGDLLDVDVNLLNLKQNDKPLLSSLRLKSQGDLKEHDIALSLTAAENNLRLRLEGSLDREHLLWQGQVADLQALTPLAGDWQLRQPSSLSFSSSRVSLTSSCLQQLNSSGQACTSVTWLAGNTTDLNLDIKDLSLSQLLVNKLPKDKSLSGAVLSSQLHAKINPGRNFPITADCDVNVSPGTLHSIIDGREYNLMFAGGGLALEIDESGLKANLQGKLFDKSAFEGSLELVDFNQLPLPKEQPISARLKAKFLDLDILPTLVSKVKNTRGQISVDVEVVGTTKRPQLQGLLKVQADTDIPDLGLALHEIDASVAADSKANQLNLDAVIHSGQGSNRIKGTVDIPTFDTWEAHMDIKGLNFETINTDAFQVWVSPDMSLDISPGQVNIEGTVNIPKAKITPDISIQTNGSKVTASADVVIIGEEESEKIDPGEVSWLMDGSLNVTLGKEIHVDVVDFKSRLEGSVIVNFVPGQTIPAGRGELRIEEGTYKAYGQDLELSSGRILFQGGPMDNPGLNIQAIRRIRSKTAFQDVNVAGIRIRGTAKTPRISLFSEPQVEDAQILSYILTGSPLSGAVNRSELSLGTYLKPSVYVSFGYDLFDNSKAFNLRYDISDKWGIEGSVGDRDSGLDFSYILGR